MSKPLTANPSKTTAPFPWLVADIGGSNARFGWVDREDGEVRHVQTLSVIEFPSPIEASQRYLHQLQSQLGEDYQAPRCAAFAVATAVGSDLVSFTNSHWNFSQQAVKAALQLDTFLVLNDFEALALSLPRLKPHQIRAHHHLPQAQGCMCVIGPGTGLGVGAVIHSAHGWVAIPGEGGHASLAATDEFEAGVLAHARQEFQHVSAERLLSGIGLPALYRGVAAMMQKEALDLSTEAIVERGLRAHLDLPHPDPVCTQTLESFCAMLGSFAGSVALILGARGGVYIGGGIVPRLGDFFFQSRFRERFEAKGRLRAYLAQIPSALITDTLAALSGAALAIEQSEV